MVRSSPPMLFLARRPMLVNSCKHPLRHVCRQEYPPRPLNEIAMRARPLVALLAVLGLIAAPASARSSEHPSIGHNGRWFTDASGRVVIFHGVNMVMKVPPYQPSAMGFGDDDAALLAHEGFNTVRLGLILKGLEPKPGVFNVAYLNAYLATVRTLGAHGI